MASGKSFKSRVLGDFHVRRDHQQTVAVNGIDSVRNEEAYQIVAGLVFSDSASRIRSPADRNAAGSSINTQALILLGIGDLVSQVSALVQILEQLLIFEFGTMAGHWVVPINAAS